MENAQLIPVRSNAHTVVVFWNSYRFVELHHTQRNIPRFTILIHKALAVAEPGILEIVSSLSRISL